MRSLLLVLALLLVSESASAQDGYMDRFGAFGGLEVRLGESFGDVAAFRGGHLAILHRERGIYAGLGGMTLFTDNTTPSGNLGMRYGGVFVGYIVPTRSFVQFTGEALAGGGRVRIDDAGSDRIFVLEPRAGVELRMGRALRLGAGISYLVVGGAADVKSADLRGTHGSVTLRYGWF